MSDSYHHTHPIFTSNYPWNQRGSITLMPTPERTGALAQYTGEGVTLAFIDSGFYAHPDLQGRIQVHVDATTDLVVEGQAIPKSQAYSWHGQMTSVIAAGDGSKSGGRYRGIASSAQLVLIKVSDERNRVKEADILRGLRWLQANHGRYNVRVVNLSVGGDHVSYDPYHPLHEAVRDLVQSGVTVVAASGNRGMDYVVPPASAAQAITVGGVDDNNTRDRGEWMLYNHNYGMGYDGSTKPDILAPARWIASPILPSTQVAMEAFWLGPLLEDNAEHPVRKLLHEGRADRGLRKLFGDGFNENLYGTLQERIYQHKIIDAFHQHVDGTSVAAAILTSVVAQVLQANPRLSPYEVRRVLKQSAERIHNFPDERQGAGVVNPAEAVYLAERT